MDVLKLTLIGHLVRDPVPDEDAVVLSIQCSYQWGNVQPKTRTTERLKVYARGKLAHIAKSCLTKDSRVYCEAFSLAGRFIAEELILLGSSKPKKGLTDSARQVA